MERHVLDQTQRNGSASEGDVPVGGFAALVPELNVIDLDVSLQFWCELLGFNILFFQRFYKAIFTVRLPLVVMFV